MTVMPSNCSSIATGLQQKPTGNGIADPSRKKKKKRKKTAHTYIHTQFSCKLHFYKLRFYKLYLYKLYFNTFYFFTKFVGSLQSQRVAAELRKMIDFRREKIKRWGNVLDGLPAIIQSILVFVERISTIECTHHPPPRKWNLITYI
jgi:hypothetical protein